MITYKLFTQVFCGKNAAKQQNSIVRLKERGNCTGMSADLKCATKSCRIETELRENIDTGIWRIGEKLPSEAELMQHFNVSRSLVRSVLARLNQDGLIKSVQGKGSFVMNPKIHVRPPHHQTIREQLELRGYSKKAELIDFYETCVTTKVAKFLSIQQDPQVFVLRQRRYVQGHPFCILELYLPRSLYPQMAGLQLGDSALNSFIETESSIQGESSREFLEMLFASPEVSALLEVNPGYPLLRLEQVNYDSRDIPQSFVQILFRGDRTRLHFDYNRPESRPDVQIFQ